MIVEPGHRAEIGGRLEKRLAAAAAAAARRGRPVLASLSIPLPGDFEEFCRELPWGMEGSRCFFWRRSDPSPLCIAAAGAAAAFEVNGGNASLTDGSGRPIPLACGAADSIRGRRGRAQVALREFPSRRGASTRTPEVRRRLCLRRRRPERRLFSIRPPLAPPRDGRLGAGTHDADALRARPGGRRAGRAFGRSDEASRRSGPGTAHRAGLPARPRPSSAPSPRRRPGGAPWRSARRRIGAGYLEKVVLARRVALRSPSAIDPARLLPRLAARFPGAYVFGAGIGSRVFLGATPELLVRRRGLRVASGSLAGSTPRGRNPRDDRRLARALVESKKNQVEHGIVIRAIREALSPHAARLSVPPAPRLLRLENVQHLYTPVTAVLAEPRGVLSLAGDLHPTPAVGGYPRADALAFMRALEGFDRGWYAGPVGWTDGAGDGEFAVAIRLALLRGRDAEIHVGAGIVGDSDPDSELAETRTKLRAILDELLEV